MSFSRPLKLRVFNGVSIQYQTVSITEKLNWIDALSPVASITDKQSLVFSLRNVRIKRYWFLLTRWTREDKVCSRWDWLVSSHKKRGKNRHGSCWKAISKWEQWLHKRELLKENEKDWGACDVVTDVCWRWESRVHESRKSLFKSRKSLALALKVSLSFVHENRLMVSKGLTRFEHCMYTRKTLHFFFSFLSRNKKCNYLRHKYR